MKSKFGSFVMAVLVITPSVFSVEPKIGDDIRIVPDVRSGDVRVVNGMSVDLAPVHKWLAAPQGDRPMKHWRQLQVYNLKAPVAGLDRCVVKTEENEFNEILVKNLPSEVRKYFRVFNEQVANITSLRSEIEADQRVVRRENAVAPIGAGGPLEYVEQASRERQQANLDAVTLKEKKELLTKLVIQHEDWQKLGPEQTKILVMNSRTKFTDLEVWDCGRQ